MMNAEEHRQTLLEQLRNRIGRRTGTPLTVAVIGTTGAGKSSFINTMITSITGNYRQRTRTGDFGGLGQTVTRRAIRIPREKYMSSADASLQEYDFPDFLDVAGFQNSNDEITSELLKLLFYGRIPSDVPLSEVAEDIRQQGVWYTEQKYPETLECKKIDRVVFVASAVDVNLPVQLMQAVSEVLRKKRDIPIFGVLTKKDRRQNNEGCAQNETDFKTTLGFSHLDYLYCTNYCDENINEIRERTRTHYPELDVPVLKFLIEVLDPDYDCTDVYRIAGFSKKSLMLLLCRICTKVRGMNNIYLLFTFVVTFLIAVILALVLSRP